MLKDVYQAVYLAINILIFNLILHVVLRSVWIGALGLRYISGEVEIDKLNYSERFTNYLNKKIGSFDQYIEKLEKLCSIIFAISFLLIFYEAAIFLVLHLIIFIDSINTSKLIGVIADIIAYLLLIGAVFTFIDYITQGLLKKNKWVVVVYFPFYWVFSYLTLSFLYRPLYYNLIDNKFGRKVSLLLLPLYISVLVISSLHREPSRLIIFNAVKSSAIIAINENYEDLVEKNNLFISAIVIQSKVITDPYIKVNIPFSDAIEDHIFEFNEGLKPEKHRRGYTSGIVIGGIKNTSSQKSNTDSLRLEYLKTFQKINTIKIDSILCNSDFVIVKEDDRKDSKFSFETYIGTNNLAEGKHVLVYSRYKHPENDSVITISEIPFWYYKN